MCRVHSIILPRSVLRVASSRAPRSRTKCEPTFWSQLTQHGLWGSVRQPATAGRARVGQRKRLGLWLIIISCRFSRFSRRRRARRRALQPFCFFGLSLAASSAGILLSGQPIGCAQKLRARSTRTKCGFPQEQSDRARRRRREVPLAPERLSPAACLEAPSGSRRLVEARFARRASPAPCCTPRATIRRVAQHGQTSRLDGQPTPSSPSKAARGARRGPSCRVTSDGGPSCSSPSSRRS